MVLFSLILLNSLEVFDSETKTEENNMFRKII